MVLAVDPRQINVFVDRKELTGYTSLRLKRSKKDMTGQLTIGVFMGWLPTKQVLGGVNQGMEILVYIGTHLAFTGIIDRRKDKSSKSTTSQSVGANQYTVTFTCRGKTKYLIDSSHQHPTGTMLAPTDKDAVETLVAPWDVPIDWRADVTQLNRIRLRDGGHVVDEIQRIAEQCSLYIWEGRNGDLVVTDDAGATDGEAIKLGTNVLNFTTDQASDQDRSQVLVKGQLTSKDAWGVAAVADTFKNSLDETVNNLSRLTVQLYGDATDELIERRTYYEMNKRATNAKKVQVEVFHVLQTDGTPWDIGDNHHVELPPAGVSDTMEIVELEYIVEKDKTLKTKLTLAPLVVKASGVAGSGLLDGLSEVDESKNIGKKPSVGVYGKTSYLQPKITAAPTTDNATNTSILSGVENTSKNSPPNRYRGNTDQ